MIQTTSSQLPWQLLLLHFCHHSDCVISGLTPHTIHHCLPHTVRSITTNSPNTYWYHWVIIGTLLLIHIASWDTGIPKSRAPPENVIVSSENSWPSGSHHLGLSWCSIVMSPFWMMSQWSCDYNWPIRCDIFCSRIWHMTKAGDGRHVRWDHNTHTRIQSHMPNQELINIVCIFVSYFSEGGIKIWDPVFEQLPEWVQEEMFCWH